jgi:hypothetical protein
MSAFSATKFLVNAKSLDEPPSIEYAAKVQGLPQNQ